MALGFVEAQVCPGFRAAGLFDSRRCWHRSGVGVLLEGGFVAAGPGGCSVEDAGLFDVPAAVAVGVSSSVSEWFPSPGVGGHEILPSGGHVAARWRRVVLPRGGQQNCPR